MRKGKIEVSVSLTDIRKDSPEEIQKKIGRLSDDELEKELNKSQQALETIGSSENYLEKKNPKKHHRSLGYRLPIRLQERVLGFSHRPSVTKSRVRLQLPGHHRCVHP